MKHLKFSPNSAVCVGYVYCLVRGDHYLWNRGGTVMIEGNKTFLFIT